MEREKLTNERLLADKKQAEQLLRETLQAAPVEPIIPKEPIKSPLQATSTKKPKKRHTRKHNVTAEFNKEQEDAWNDPKLFPDSQGDIQPSIPAPMLASWSMQQGQNTVAASNEPIDFECELDHGYFPLKTKLRLCSLLIHYAMILYNNVDFINNKRVSEKFWEDGPSLVVAIFEAQVITELFNYLIIHALNFYLDIQIPGVCHELEAKERPNKVKLKVRYN